MRGTYWQCPRSVGPATDVFASAARNAPCREARSGARDDTVSVRSLRVENTLMTDHHRRATALGRIEPGSAEGAGELDDEQRGSGGGQWGRIVAVHSS